MPASGFELTVTAEESSSPGATTEPASPAARSHERKLRYRSVDVGDTLGRYDLVDELGAGGMATVYLARDIELRREVAIKVLFAHLTKRREVVVRFHREARAAAGLDHNNIVRVYDVGGGPLAADDSPEQPALCDPPYIVMELVRGQSLQEFIKAHGAEHGHLLGEVVACMGAVLCDALTAAHDAGIIHRDVKPGNIMVTEGGRLALTDFGVARIEDDDSSVVTRTGALVGTPAYMSPEQAMGDNLDARSDLYSLGATLYRLATGAMPFTGPTARVVTAIARGDVKPPLMRNPAMGPDLSWIIRRMMARDPAQRYHTCADAARSLRELVARSGLGDPAEELAAFFADSISYDESHTTTIIRATLAQARTSASDRDLPRAMALADRVMALDKSGPHGVEAMALVEGLGDGLGWRKFAVIGAGVAAVAAVIAAWLVWGGDDAAIATHQDGGDGAVIALDIGVSDGNDRAIPTVIADAAIDAAAPVVPTDASRRIARNGRKPPRRRDASVAPPPDASPMIVKLPDAAPPRRVPDAAPPAQATVQLDIRPWCDLTIDGVDYKRSRRDRVISLAPGRHELVCSQSTSGKTWRKTITLKPGEHRQLKGSVLQAVRVRIRLSPGLGIKLRGQRYVSGDSIELTPGRYRFDLFKGTQALTGDWVAIPAVAACTLRDKPKLSCYR